MRCCLTALAALVSACGFEATPGSTVQDAPAEDGRDARDGGIPGIDALLDAPLLDASGDCIDSTITASKTYNPSVTTIGMLVAMPPYNDLIVPSTLSVTMGNSGNHCAELAFKLADNRLARCRYRGGASTSSPTSGTDLTEIQNGLRYVFDQCREGAACPSPNGTMLDIDAGESVALASDLTPITLRIDNGDANAGATVIEHAVRRCLDR